MKIKKVDDKPMVIHTKEKAKIHAHEPKGAKIKGSNIYTVERGPKVHDAKANEMDKKASAKLMLQKSAGGKSTYRKSTIHQSEAKIIGNIIFPLIFALLLNELALKRLKRPIQTIVYLPYFLSWVILAKIVLNIFGYTGPINHLIQLFGGDPINFFGEAKLFQPLVIGTDIWKGFGYNTVVYLAAILGVDKSLYEAAAADGAGRFKRIWHVTLPGIRTTVALLAILSLGNVLNAGFDQIYNLYNPLVYSTGDVIDTWVYRAGLQNLQYSLATAVGLFKSVISVILIALGYRLADKFTGYKLF